MPTKNRYLKLYHSLNTCNAACVLITCATAGHESLRASAARLSDGSDHFAAQFRYYGDEVLRKVLSRNADAMAKSTCDLDGAVSNSHTCVEIEDKYYRVIDTYLRLHLQLANKGHVEHDRRVLADFNRITSAYRSVEVAMQRRTVSLRYQNQLLYQPVLRLAQQHRQQHGMW